MTWHTSWQHQGSDGTHSRWLRTQSRRMSLKMSSTCHSKPWTLHLREPKSTLAVDAQPVAAGSMPPCGHLKVSSSVWATETQPAICASAAQDGRDGVRRIILGKRQHVAMARDGSAQQALWLLLPRQVSDELQQSDPHF